MTNTKIHIILSLLALSVLIVGCHQRTIREELLDAGNIMDDNPDSAYTILSCITDSNRLNGGNRALFRLLYTQAKWKTNRNIASDTLLDCPIAYFAENNDVDNLAKAYYYKGVILYEMKRHKSALSYLKKSEETAVGTDDELLKNMIYESLYMVNYDARCHEMMLRYGKQMLASSYRIGDKECICRSLSHLSSAFYEMGKADSAYIYISRCIPMIDSIGKTERAYVLNNLGYLLCCKKNYSKAIKYLKQSIKDSTLLTQYKILGDVYAASGNYKVADSLWTKALKTTDSELKLSTCNSIIDMDEKRGDFRDAFMMMKTTAKLNDSIGRRRETVSIMAIQAKYDKEKTERVMYKRITFLLLSFILFASFVCFYYYVNRKRMRRLRSVISEDAFMISNFRARIDELESSGGNVEKEVSALHGKIDDLQRNIFESLHLGRSIFESIKGGGTMAGLSCNDEKCFIEYYKILFFDKLRQWENDYASLSPRLITFLVLNDMGYDDETICRILCVSNSAIRSIKSRIKSYKNIK